MVLRPWFIQRRGIADEVRKQKLADCKVRFVFLEDSICVGLSKSLSRSREGGLVFLLDLPHRFDVGAKIGLEGCVDGGVVDGDEAGVGGWRAEGEGHGYFCAPVIHGLVVNTRAHLEG